MRQPLVTGSEGFIGKHLVSRLKNLGLVVIEVDRRINETEENPNRIGMDINNPNFASLVKRKKPDTIFHLAARGGVHQSTIDPIPYIKDNMDGFFNVIKIAAESSTVKNFIYASSSSIESTTALNFYGTTKRYNESIATLFSEPGYNLNVWGIRYFSVYGPGGRADMAIPIFMSAVYNEQEIILYGNPERYYTYVADIVEATIGILTKSCGLYNAYHDELINLENDVITRLRLWFNKKPQVTYDYVRSYETELKIGDFPNLIKMENSTRFELGLKRTVDHYLEKMNETHHT